MPQEPVLTPEEEAEHKILQQDDAVQIICKDMRPVGEPIVWSALESKKLDRRVTMIHEYYELTDEQDQVIGHQAWGGTKHITRAGETPPEAQNRARIIGRRKRGE